MFVDQNLKRSISHIFAFAFFFKKEQKHLYNLISQIFVKNSYLTLCYTKVAFHRI